MTKKQSKRPYETPKVLHDAPVENCSADFHFDDYAATLARLIADKTTETPLVIGISGTWGAGKTSLLRRVQAMLEPTQALNDPGKPAVLEFVNPDENPQSTYRVCRTVWFNAWKYADEEQLLVALVRVIVQSMAEDSMVQGMIGKLLDPAYPRRDVVGTVLSWFSIKLPADVGLALNTGEPKETRFGEKTATLDLFDEAFDRLMAAWVHQTLYRKKIDPAQGVLAVFIDDLDCCLPVKTVQVLEAVKLFLDKKGCIFVLGADTEVVRAAVQSHYENAKVKDENADKYLEKVIQLRFELPPIVPASMQAYLGREDSRVDPAMQEQWETLIAAAEINPRRVKAVINSVNLLWAMFKNSDERAASVERADFIRWQAIGQAAPDEFKRRAHEMDADLRFDFISDALRWAKGQGDETVNATFRDYEKYTRLRRALREVHFGEKFNFEALDAFIHLVAPAEKPILPAPALHRTQDGVPQVQVSKVEGPVPSNVEEHLPVGRIDNSTYESSAEEPAEVESNLPVNFGLEAEPILETAKSVTRGDKPAGSREGALTVGEMEFMLVPKGKFIMGSKDDDPQASDDEKPQHSLEIPYDYWLARFTVTNEQFAQFAKASGYKTTAEEKGSAYAYNGAKWEDIKGANWQHPRGPKSGIAEKADHPVVAVSWLDAMQYCSWFNQTFQEMRQSGKYSASPALHPQRGASVSILPSAFPIRLPTEAEWEKAARGAYGNIYPWGNDFDPKRLNFVDNSKMETAPVGAFPNGASPYGCEQMAGNVWEWTHTLFEKYPYVPDAKRENEKDKTSNRVLRGGSFGLNRQYLRSAFRSGSFIGHRRGGFGFRLCVAPRLEG